MRLSICIITKNECNKLARLLASTEKLGCEIVVVDTGSTDDTIEISYRYTDKVYCYKWCDDFAAAKNYAIKLASNDVVMMLDSDEWITDFEPKNKTEVEKLVEKLESDVFGKNHVGRVNLINILENNGERCENSEWISRIFNREFFKYEGRIHEQIVRREESVYMGITGDKEGDGSDYADSIRPKDDYDVVRSAVRIYHDGYMGSPEEKKKKACRNISLLKAELDSFEINSSEDEKDIKKKVYILYQLGKSCYMAGDYYAAADYFDRALEYNIDSRLEYVADMVETYGYALINSGQEKKALGLEGIMDEFGAGADFCFLMGLVYMKNAMFDRAIFCFDEALQKPVCRMQGVNSFLSQYNKGVIYECVGRIEDAAECYKKAGDYPKAKEGLRRLKMPDIP